MQFPGHAFKAHGKLNLGYVKKTKGTNQTTLVQACAIITGRFHDFE